MPDQGTIDSVATKFETWAASLSTDEQRTLAEWWDARNNADVVGHADANWWQEPGAWSGAWMESWSS
jgi:hypothetical protein